MLNGHNSSAERRAVDPSIVKLIENVMLVNKESACSRNNYADVGFSSSSGFSRGSHCYD